VIVDRDDHHRQLPHARGIHRFVEVALRGRAVAAHHQRDARLAAQLHRIGDAGGMRHLRADGDVERKIPRRLGEHVAALIAAPIEERAVRRNAAQHEHAALAVARPAAHPPCGGTRPMPASTASLPSVEA